MGFYGESSLLFSTISFFQPLPNRPPRAYMSREKGLVVTTGERRQRILDEVEAASWVQDGMTIAVGSPHRWLCCDKSFAAV